MNKFFNKTWGLVRLSIVIPQVSHTLNTSVMRKPAEQLLNFTSLQKIQADILYSKRTEGRALVL